MAHRCPVCNSDQITSYLLKWPVYWVECVNCDYEGMLGTLADMADYYDWCCGEHQARARERGR